LKIEELQFPDEICPPPINLVTSSSEEFWTTKFVFFSKQNWVSSSGYLNG